MTQILPLLTLEARIKRRLRCHLRTLGFRRGEHGELEPPDHSKDTLRSLHAAQRVELLRSERPFVNSSWAELSCHFADGDEVSAESISPRLEMVGARTWQARLFRLASLAWSLPVSQGYGRRIRYLVWDENNSKLIGLVALGDPVFNLRVRDQWIGWTVRERKERLINVLDAFVLGAVPPYSLLLGGKLVASLLRSVDVVRDFESRYHEARGIISGRKKRPHLALITTTSAFGRSSVYNRLSLGGQPIFTSIGFTEGWGHFHIPDDLFGLMVEFLAARRHPYAHGNRFGQGPNWKIRSARTALTLLQLKPHLLRHGVRREVFASCVASNAVEFLRGSARRPSYDCLPSVREIGEMARTRWIIPRSLRRPEYRSWNREELLRLLRSPHLSLASQLALALTGTNGSRES